MRINKNRSRSTTAPDFLQNFAVGHLREAAASVFLRSRHTQHPDATKAINHVARNVRLPVDLRRIEMFVQKFAEPSERIIQLILLGLRNARIRHHPIGNEMSREQSLGKTKRLR